MTRVTPESGPAGELARPAAELLGPAISESASDIELLLLLSHWAGCGLWSRGGRGRVRVTRVAGGRMMAAPPARGPSLSESASDLELPLPSHWAGRVKSTSAVASSVSRLVSAMVVTDCAAGGGRGHGVGGRQAMLEA